MPQESNIVKSIELNPEGFKNAEINKFFPNKKIEQKQGENIVIKSSEVSLPYAIKLRE
jgi:hypothetical protein